MIEYWISTTRTLLLCGGILAILASFYISRGKTVPWKNSTVSRAVFFGGLCWVILGQLFGGLLRLLS
jgi:hypothetical protein